MLLRGECGTTPNARVFRHAFRVTRKHCACTSNRYSLSLPPSLSHSQIQTLSVFFNLLFVFHSSSFMANRRVINRSYTAVHSVHLTGPYNSQLTLCVFCNEFYSFSFRLLPCCVFARFLFALVLFICLYVIYLTTLLLSQRRMIGQNWIMKWKGYGRKRWWTNCRYKSAFTCMDIRIPWETTG